MYSKKKRGILATVGALVTAVALAFSGAAAASAAPGELDVPLILPGTAGEPITGNVTVHKHEQQADLGAPANGLAQEVTNPTIAGVTFTAKKISSATVGGDTHTFDLSTNQGWLNAAKLVRAVDGTWTFDGAAAAVTTDSTRTENTGPVGGTYKDAVFADLPIGLYLFEETAAPANVTKSAPWVMAVPLTDPVGDPEENIEPNSRWNYDLHVYPKNSITGLGKTVQDAGATKVGDTISWTITGDIPLVANAEFDTEGAVSADNLKFFAPTAYVIKDNLDDRLTPASTNPVAVTMLNGVALTAVTDYTVAWDPSATTAGADLTLTFTEAGRNKLALAVSQATAPADVKVQVVLNTVVTTLTTPEEAAGTIGDGIIKNQAQLFPNESAVNSDTPVLSPEPESRWGDILISKVDAQDGTKLPDASFKVYTSEANALAGSDAVSINGVSEFTTGPDGQVRISGLRHSNYANGEVIPGDINAEEENEGWQYYWIVESKSPEGYELLAAPYRVTVTNADAEVTITKIENVPSNGGFELPLTGGTGTLFLTILGVGILAVVLVVARRRNTISTTE